MKTLILSYDYELFFGLSSGSILNTIINPTNKLLNHMDKAGLKGNFFVDYLMIKRLKGCQDSFCQMDLLRLEKQLRDIVRRGHRIELHIHSHWVDATYMGNGFWDFSDFHRYSLSSFSITEINKMFSEGVSYLNAIGSSVIPDYKVCAFRAGGWAVQPFSNLKEAFEICNIKIDSSVAYKTIGKEENSEYDFLGAPPKDMYRYCDDVCSESESGKFLEVPIYTIQRNLFDKGLDKLIRMLTPFFKQYSDGTHFRPDSCLKNNSFSNKRSKRSMFSISFLNTISLILHLYLAKEKKIFCLIDHPKDINPIALLNIRVLCFFAKSILYKDLL